MKLDKARTLILLCLFLLAGIATTCAPFLGAKTLDPHVLVMPFEQSMDAEIFWRLRLPRVLLAFLCGSALSVCGMVFQACFRNPLATPYTLGVSSGASLGAVCYLFLGLKVTILGISGLSLASFFGALGAIISVYGLAGGRHRFSPAAMLLAGVAMSLFFSSLIMFLQYFSDFGGSMRIVRWLMGSLDTVSMEPVKQLLPLVLPGLIIIVSQARALNLLTLDEEMAANRGINPHTTRRLLYFATSLTVGGVVAVCGPIGFIGLIAPHICRLVIGWDHRYLVWASILFGGTFLTLCDLLSRMLIAPAEIPVGVITALLGGPFFLWMLKRKFSTDYL